jgi:hypothetical protein
VVQFLLVYTTTLLKLVVASIRMGSAIAASDGSLKAGLGTAAFVIEDGKGTGRLKGVNKVPGSIKEGDSHRCKMAGLYAIILRVKEICSMHEVTSSSITVLCDNKTALQIFDPNILPDPKMKNFDLITACWALKRQVPIEWKPKHVKGHQDQGMTYMALSKEARLNVEMDKTAMAYWTHLMACQKHPYPENHEVYGEEWQLWERAVEKITWPFRHRLYSILQDRETNMWWIRHGHVPSRGQKTIDYEATAQAMRALQPTRRRYVTKAASNNYGIGTTLVEWKFAQTAACP